MGQNKTSAKDCLVLCNVEIRAQMNNAELRVKCALRMSVFNHYLFSSKFVI